MNNTTINNAFPVIDITHKPERTQDYYLRDSEDCVATPLEKPDNIPQNNITIERAIQFFLDNAQGEFERLYKQTARYLKAYLSNEISDEKDREK